MSVPDFSKYITAPNKNLHYPFYHQIGIHNRNKTWLVQGLMSKYGIWTKWVLALLKFC